MPYKLKISKNSSTYKYILVESVYKPLQDNYYRDVISNKQSILGFLINNYRKLININKLELYLYY